MLPSGLGSAVLLHAHLSLTVRSGLIDSLDAGSHVVQLAVTATVNALWAAPLNDRSAIVRE